MRPPASRDGYRDRGKAMSQRNRDDMADCIESDAYWIACAGNPKRLSLRLAALLGRVVRGLRGEDQGRRE